MLPRVIEHTEPGEKVILVLRRFWFTPLGVIFSFFIFTLIPFGIYQLFLTFTPHLLDNPIVTPLLAMVACLYYLAVWLFSFTDFLDYWLDLWVITTHRIINIEQCGLFKRTSSELNLSSVQDVTAEISGPLQTFFHYGNVYVQTASEQQRFQMKNVPNAEAIKETIMLLSEEDRMREQRG